MNAKILKKEARKQRWLSLPEEEREQIKQKQEEAHQRRVRKEKNYQKLRFRSKYGRGKRRTIKKKLNKIQLKILSKCEEGLEMRMAGEKGRGVFATKSFAPRDFLCEYAGELITRAEGLERDIGYDQNPDFFGSYMMYFTDKETCKEMCIDATAELVPSPLGRLVNHVSTEPNVKRDVIDINGVPHVYFFAAKAINKGDELLYTYGENRPHIIAAGNEFLLPGPAVAGKSK